jgi:hypothetical protein
MNGKGVKLDTPKLFVPKCNYGNEKITLCGGTEHVALCDPSPALTKHLYWRIRTKEPQGTCHIPVSGDGSVRLR